MADTLLFKTRSRREDPFGHKTVELNLDDLLNAYNAFVSKFKRGNAVVASGTTTVTVSHSLGSSNFVAVSPLADPGGRWWISGKSATQFTINLQVAAPVGGVAFDYHVIGA